MIPKFANDVRIGRICGGSGLKNKSQGKSEKLNEKFVIFHKIKIVDINQLNKYSFKGGTGPMRHWRSFHDGSSRLTKYPGPQCPIVKRRRKGKVINERKPCLQNGFDNWIEIESDSVTIAFDSDQKKSLTGFTMVWETVDAPQEG